ncbi:MAG: hypothetical protein ACYDAL_16395 [Candidatus Dormibacteraceae bacterium]
MAKLVVITGRRGKGKTSLAYKEARDVDARGVVVFDPTQSFSIGAIAQDPASFDMALEGNASPAVYQVENLDFKKNAIEEDLQHFVASTKHIRDIGVVIDETSYLQSPNYIAPALDDEIRVGRRRRHDVFLTQHRMADCNGILLDLVTDFYFFQTKSPRSLERIAEYCGDHVAGLVSGLGDFEFLYYHVESGRFHVNNSPDSWRVSIAPEQEVAAEPLLADAAD